VFSLSQHIPCLENGALYVALLCGLSRMTPRSWDSPPGRGLLRSRNTKVILADDAYPDELRANR
jgi:hypothetical protein